MNTPKIRIKGFCGDWNNSLIGDLFDERVEYNPLAEMLTVSINRGIYRAADNGRYDNSSANKSKYKLVKVGDIAYNSMRMWQGASGCSQLEGIVSPAYTVIKPREDINSFFFAYLFKTKRMIRTFRLNSQGLTSDTWNLKYPALSQIRVSYPCDLSEQRSIAEYFRNIDSLIETAEKKLISLKQVKEASLQSMFPKEGCTVPHVRFKGFEGDWNKMKLSSIAKRVTRKNTNLETQLPVTISSQDGIVAQTSFFNNVVASSNLRGYYLIKKGEFAYNKSYSNGYPFGSVKRLEKYDMGALSTLYIVFSLNEDVCQDYILTFFETDLWHKEVAMRASEGARNHGLLNIGADDFLDIEITLPPDIEEQRKIASFFVNLYKAIENQKQRLELLKCIKSTCLSEMFV